MKKLLLGTVALVVMGATVPALAADLGARRPYTKAPEYAPAPIYNWTGFYIGGHIGGAFGVLCLLRPAPCRARVTDLARFALLCLLCALPYLWYVEWAEGLGRWVVDSLGPAHVVRDVAQRLPMLPALGGTTAVEAISAGRMAEMIALGFSTWVISAVPYVALALCGVTWLRAGGPSVEVRIIPNGPHRLRHDPRAIAAIFGTSSPRCSYARGVAMRPRGVRASRPCCSRKGS